MTNSTDHMDEVICRVLGDDHKLVLDIQNNKPVLLTDVLFSCIESIDLRLRLIEERKIH